MSEDLKKSLKPIPETDEVEGSREKLKEVAIRLFAERGLDGVSTRDIAREAGVNMSLISYYFGGKEGLYKTAVFEFAQAAAAELNQLTDGYNLESLDRESFVSLMRGVIEGIVNFKLSSPHMSELMMREVLAGLPHLREVYEKLSNSVATRLMSVLSIAQSRGLLRQDVNVQVVFFSMVHSMDSYFFARKCETPFTQAFYRLPEEKHLLIDQFVKIFVEGVME